MRIDRDERLEAYTLAIHQLVTAMASVQAWVRMAKQGDVDLMEPDVLENLEHLVLGENTLESMDPIGSYMKRKVNK